MISLCICQPCVPKRRSGLLDHLTLHFIMFFSTEWHVFYLLPMYTSWRAVWHSRPFNQCWSRFVRANWHRLYGITDRSISVDHALYGPIGIQEVFTFNFKKTKPREPVILNFSPFVWFPSIFVNPMFLRKGQFIWLSNSLLQRVLLYRVRHVFYSSPMHTSWRAVWHYRPFDQCWSQSVRANWHGLYGITDRSISVDLGLYGPIDI